MGAAFLSTITLAVNLLVIHAMDHDEDDKQAHQTISLAAMKSKAVEISK